jgi:hypothetical protein
MERRNSGRPDREVHVSLETSRAGEQCLSDSYEHLLPWRRLRREQARDSLRGSFAQRYVKRHGLAQPFQADFEGLSESGQGEHLQRAPLPILT